MKRRLFNLAALLSLILCLGCLFMWVRSGFHYDDAKLANGTVGKVAIVSHGGSVLMVLVTASPSSPWPNEWTCRFVSFEEGTGWRWRWPAYSSHTTAGDRLNMPGTYRAVSLPYWLLTPGFSILPVQCLWKRRKEKRLPRRGFEVEVKQEAES